MLSEYDLDIFYVPEKDLIIANKLLRFGGYPLFSLSLKKITIEVFTIDEVLMADNSKKKI